MKLQILFDVIFASIMIAFIHFLVILFSPGPIPAEVRAILDWFTH